MTAIYNEIEPFAVAWLKNLEREGHIARGTIDGRSIADLQPADLAGYRQCHFFAGIGVWSYALRLAGWPDDAPVWTGSCPCQPFSAAGKRGGFSDERHLWPAWFRLIRECRPPVVFGEQVASDDGLRWLDLVSADLEDEGYAVAAADLCAAGVGAPHIRQRLYFVAYAAEQGRGSRWRAGGSRHGRDTSRVESGRLRDAGLVAYTDGQRNPAAEEGVQGADGEWQRLRPDAGERRDPLRPWADAEWIPCLDGRRRPVEPGTFPLAHGAPARVGRLRAYGNAIVPQVAAMFIRAATEAMR